MFNKHIGILKIFKKFDRTKVAGVTMLSHLAMYDYCEFKSRTMLNFENQLSICLLWQVNIIYSCSNIL